MTPSVAYFANQFAAAEGHGMRRYAHELFDAIRAEGEAALHPTAGWSNLEAGQLASMKDETGLQLMPMGRRGTSWGWTFLRFPPMEWAMSGQIDVAHAVCMGYPVATRKPLVVTVHDLGPLTHPEFFSHNRPWLMEAALKQAVNQADAIVAISQATADEIVSIHGTAAGDRLHIVHSGVSESFFDTPDMSALEGLDLPPPDVPFILAAGKTSPRKNIQGVLRAMKRIAGEVPHHVVLTGGDGWDVDVVEKELADTELASRVHMLGFISDEALHALYRRAAIYIHPSLFEGFGLTVLEAMASGVPMITSNMSSLPEVAGDAALLVDPRDPEDIAGAILRLATEPGLADTLREAGLAQARRFPWSATARKMIEIYKDVAK